MVNLLIIHQLVNVGVIAVVQIGQDHLVELVLLHVQLDQPFLIVTQDLVDVQVHLKHSLLVVLSVILLHVVQMAVLIPQPVLFVNVIQIGVETCAKPVIGDAHTTDNKSIVILVIVKHHGMDLIAKIALLHVTMVVLLMQLMVIVDVFVQIISQELIAKTVMVPTVKMVVFKEPLLLQTHVLVHVQLAVYGEVKTVLLVY